MIKIANAQFWVHDQDEALAFYVGTLGWEVRADVAMPDWNFRWLCVGPKDQEDIGLVLMPVPGPPMLDADASGQLAELVAKGAGGTLFLETDDCQQGLRRPVGPRRDVQRSADAAGLWDRHVVSRPVGQQRAPDPGARLRPDPRRLRGLPGDSPGMVRV